jgi:Ca2+-transporting ATPase
LHDPEKNGKAEGQHPVSQRPLEHEHEWHALETKAVLDHLKVEGNGLTSEEAKRRLEQFGPNQLQEAPRPTFLQMLWEQLNNFVVILLIVASLISALLGDYVEAAAIMAIVVLNAILGIVQERLREALPLKLDAPDAQVVRDDAEYPFLL